MVCFVQMVRSFITPLSSSVLPCLQTLSNPSYRLGSYIYMGSFLRLSDKISVSTLRPPFSDCRVSSLRARVLDRLGRGEFSAAFFRGFSVVWLGVYPVLLAPFLAIFKALLWLRR